MILTNETDLSVQEFVDLLVRSTLAERRPIHDRNRIAKMIENAQLMVTARDEDGLLVGLARSITDFSYCCYCSDLAVDVAYQGQGIGKALIEETRKIVGPGVTFLLLSAPKAMDYYPKIGLEKFENCFGIRGSNLSSLL